MPTKRRLFFCSSEDGSWIDRDYELLCKDYEVTRMRVTKKALLNASWIKNIITHDLIFIWFASYYVFPLVLIGALMGKTIVFVTGGFDVAKAPEIQHGAYTKSWWKRALRTWILKRARKIFCVSQFNRQEAIQNAGLAAEKCVTIPLAVQPPVPPFRRLDWAQRKAQVVMIASVTEASVRTKGLDQLLNLANEMPQTQFLLLGRLDVFCQKFVEQKQLKNLKLLGFVPYQSEIFLQTLNESRVAVQLSFYESFGSGIIDAGMCGCEMIVTDRAALPETVQGLGQVVPYGDTIHLKTVVKKTLEKSDSEIEVRAERLAQAYSLEKRRQLLVSELNRLLA